MQIPDFSSVKLTGRNRRLLHEWKAMEERLQGRDDISYEVRKRNAQGLPVSYTVHYRMLSICGVEEEERLNEPGIQNFPKFAGEFVLIIDIPAGFPAVDAMPVYSFQTTGPDNEGIPHPWHPNIRYYGAFAGRVCLNLPDTYTDIVQTVRRIAEYLRYERFHAKNEPPFPEDLKVARWVMEQGEPNGWIYFDQEERRVD